MKPRTESFLCALAIALLSGIATILGFMHPFYILMIFLGVWIGAFSVLKIAKPGK